MEQLKRGRKLVNMCNSNKKFDSQNETINESYGGDITLKTIATSRNYGDSKNLLSQMKFPDSQYENSLWSRHYSLILPVFKKINECQISDLNSIDKVLSNTNDILFSFNTAVTSTISPKHKSPEDQHNLDLTCYEEISPSMNSDKEFDSDDSVKDEDYVPPINISNINSFNSEEDERQVKLTSSKGETENKSVKQGSIDKEIKSGQIKSLLLLSKDAVNRALSRKRIVKESENKRLELENKTHESDEEMVVVVIEEELTDEEVAGDASKMQESMDVDVPEEEITEAEEKEKAEQEKETDGEEEKEEEVDVGEEEREEAEEEVNGEEEEAVEEEEVDGKEERDETLYTKSGTIRKRKKYDTSVLHRQLEKKTKYRENFFVKEGCTNKCIKKCMEKFNEEERKAINNNYWKLNWKERRIFIQENSCVATPKRKITVSPKRHPRRTFNLKTKEKENTAVCKIFFLTTLGYKKSNDKVLYNTLRDDEVKEDLRGKHMKTKKCSNNYF